MKILETLRDLIFPDSIYCIGCGAIIDRSRPYALCDSCREKFHFANGKTCRVCGRILTEDYYTDICNDCLRFERNFDRGYTTLQYGLYERPVLRQFKYSGRAYYAKHLGRMMADRLRLDMPEAELVVPVPLHPDKLKLRGYNQAGLLAKVLAEELGLEYADVLERTVATTPMAHLSREQRMMNLDGVFRVREDFLDEVRGRSIILVDDIYTTGSTAENCIAALRDAGADKVICYTLAAGGNPPPDRDLQNEAPL